MENADLPYWSLQLTTTYLSTLSLGGLFSRNLCFVSLAAFTVLNSIYRVIGNEISGIFFWAQSQSKKFSEARECVSLFLNTLYL